MANQSPTVSTGNNHNRIRSETHIDCAEIAACMEERESEADSMRIRDFSFLDAEDIKLQNTQFLEDPDHEYTRLGYDSPNRLRREIWRVRNGDLRTLLRQFPHEEPLVDQCALWMQAFVGVFPDANHRTAVVLLREMLGENGIPPGSWPPARTRLARKQSHDVRARLPPITLATIYERDALYDVWYNFFDEILEVPNE